MSVYRFSEKKSDKGILYKEGAYSSLSYIISGLYLLSHKSKYSIRYFVSLYILLLGIISFTWWSYRSPLIHRYDITLYSSMFSYFCLVPIIVIKPDFDYLCTFLFIVISLVMFILTSQENRDKIFKYLNSICFVVSITSISYVYQSSNKKNLVLGLILSILGIILKILDINNIKIPFMVGTAWFHILTSIGLPLMIDSFN